MQYLILVILTIFSCIIYERLRLLITLKKLIHSYREQLSVMYDKSLEDEMKQKKLLTEIQIQLKLLFILSLKILILVSPFLLFIGMDKLIFGLGFDLFYNISGIIISLLSILLFIILRKIYVRLFINRKISA